MFLISTIILDCGRFKGARGGQRELGAGRGFGSLGFLSEQFGKKVGL